MKKPRISVVIPMYNGESYISRCLNSLKVQTFADFEAIIVDDGSTDNSAVLAEKFTMDSRFSLLRQENKGAGGARNAALSHAVGKYVTFLDSDDALTPYCLEKLYAAAEENDADIAICGYYIYSGEKLSPKRLVKARGVYPAEKILGSMVRDITVKSNICGKIYKRELFTENNILFPLHMFEDSEIVPQLTARAKNIAVIKERCYLYTRRNGSTTSMSTFQSVEDYSLARRNARLALKKMGVKLPASMLFNAAQTAATTYFLHARLELGEILSALMGGTNEDTVKNNLSASS